MDTDIRIISARPLFPDAEARVPLKFGAVVVEKLPFCHVKVEVENCKGDRAVGWGAMFLMDLWAWPVSPVPHEQRSQAMIATTRALCKLYEESGECGHPIELYQRLEPSFQDLAERVCAELKLEEAMPLLCTLVCASPTGRARSKPGCPDTTGPSRADRR